MLAAVSVGFSKVVIIIIILFKAVRLNKPLKKVKDEKNKSK